VTPAQYIAATEDAKRADLRALDALIRKTVPSFAPYVAGTMLGYGKYHYRYASGREGDSCRVGLVSNKTGFSIYVSAMDEKGYLAEQAKDRLGKASIGKSCIRFRRVADLRLDVLVEVLEKAATLPAPGEAAATATTPSAKKNGSTRTAPKKHTGHLSAPKKALPKKALAKKKKTRR
jgi:hypothetical protein